MTVRVLPADEALTAPREEPTVCLLWPDLRGAASDTLADIFRYTSPLVPVLLVGATDRELGDVEAALQDEEVGDREVYGLAREDGAGFARVANVAAGATARNDLVFVAPGVRLGPTWLERLTAAAHCDSTVVSATALGDHAGALSVNLDGVAVRAETLSQPAVSLAVISRSPRVYPRVTCAGTHCVYLRRALLDRLDGFDERILGPGDAIIELSLRALALGMMHVVADDVFVICPVGSPPSETAIVAADLKDERTALRRSLACAHVALEGMSVTIDARALGQGVGGTQLYTMELILALAASAGLRLRVVVSPDLPATVAGRLGRESTIEVITYEQAVAGVQSSDVVHRPQQVFTEDDLRLLHLLGDRVIVGQQDLISYRNPAYHESIEAWQRYRRVTRLSLAVADRVVFFSEHAMRDTVAEDLVARGRCSVAGIGADSLGARQTPSAPVAGVPVDRDLLVCLGADYGHKNRPFAIALLRALEARHGWEGCLVFAGTHVPHGSSREEEAALLAEHPELAESVIDVGSVDEAQKASLFERARAVVYPTLYEGFGLIPFEAAQAGTPCLFAPQASLVELAGPGAATLIPWDAPLSADAVAPLLVEGSARTEHLELLRRGAAQARWSDVVGRLLETYEVAIGAPQRAAAPRAWQELERETFITSLERVAEDYQLAYHDLRESVGPGLPLVAEGGLLTRDEQRGLMRIASRRALHAVMLSPIGVLGRLDPRRRGSAENVSGHDQGALQAEAKLGEDPSARC